MSYILDALKRADAERERGRVPGLHSQATPAPESRAEPPQESQAPARRSRLLLAALLVMVLTALAWTLSQTIRDTPSSSTPASPPLGAPATEPPPVAAQVAPVPDAPVTTPPPVRAQPILAPRAPPAPSAPAAPAPTAAKAPAMGRDIHSFANLSTEQRAQLPQLNISGASYSENPAHRLLIINGQIAQEGQEVAPGLVLERIGLNEAVLNQRGLRFRIGY